MKFLLLFFVLTSSCLSFGSKVDELFPNKQEKNQLFEKISTQATTSALFHFCKKDWQTSYLKFMSSQRAEKKWKEEQLAFIGTYHGTLMEMKNARAEFTSKS